MTEKEKPEDVNALVEKIALATAITSREDDIQPSSNIELTNKVVDTLFDMLKRKMLGILSFKQVAGIKKLYIINDIIFDNRESVLTRIINNEIDLSVSVSGKGREQLVTLTKVEDPIEPQMGRIKRYLQ